MMTATRIKIALQHLQAAQNALSDEITPEAAPPVVENADPGVPALPLPRFALRNDPLCGYMEEDSKTGGWVRYADVAKLCADEYARGMEEACRKVDLGKPELPKCTGKDCTETLTWGVHSPDCDLAGTNPFDPLAHEQTK